MLVATLALAQGGAWLDVPFVRQSEEGCGAAAISMVMRYWGHDAEPEPILRELYTPQLKGIRAADMARYFRQHGFRTFEFKGEWSDLDEHIAKGRPLVVALREGANALHYVIVAGVTDAAALVNDPARRKLLRVDRTDFERRWQKRWTLLAVPAEAK
ncbi:MAG TPA: cysteine peptidase family C39 domain-containing protein [Bryobacteraceae bacterium]|nr:cysteine peptidase family C39 domain-containing protein [Bryobacteraceae bacterium]